MTHDGSPTSPASKKDAPKDRALRDKKNFLEGGSPRSPKEKTLEKDPALRDEKVRITDNSKGESARQSATQKASSLGVLSSSADHAQSSSKEKSVPQQSHTRRAFSPLSFVVIALVASQAYALYHLYHATPEIKAMDALIERLNTLEQDTQKHHNMIQKSSARLDTMDQTLTRVAHQAPTHHLSSKQTHTETLSQEAFQSYTLGQSQLRSIRQSLAPFIEETVHGSQAKNPHAQVAHMTAQYTALQALRHRLSQGMTYQDILPLLKDVLNSQSLFQITQKEIQPLSMLTQLPKSEAIFKLPHGFEWIGRYIHIAKGNGLTKDARKSLVDDVQRLRLVSARQRIALLIEKQPKLLKTWAPWLETLDQHIAIAHTLDMAEQKILRALTESLLALKNFNAKNTA